MCTVLTTGWEPVQHSAAGSHPEEKIMEELKNIFAH